MTTGIIRSLASASTLLLLISACSTTAEYSPDSRAADDGDSAGLLEMVGEIIGLGGLIFGLTQVDEEREFAREMQERDRDMYQGLIDSMWKD